MNSRPMVVALRALKLGDLLTAVPALRALRAAFPEHEMVLAAPAWLAPLAGLTAAVDRFVAVDGLAPLRLPQSRPAIAVNLHGRGPASHRVLLATRPWRLIAFANAAIPESMDMPAWNDDEHEVDRWCRLLTENDIPADPSRLDLPAPAPPPGVPSGPDVTVIHPG